jgi:hypothetical protein
MARSLGFRSGEQTPPTFVEMRQHRRLAFPERIFVDHSAKLRRRAPGRNPIAVQVKNRFNYFLTEP